MISAKAGCWSAELTLSGSQRDFPLISDGRVVGILTPDRSMRSLVRDGPSTRVGAVMSMTFDTVEARQMLEPVMERIGSNGSTMVPVLDNGRLAGLLTAENVGDLIGIRTAMSVDIDSDKWLNSTLTEGTSPQETAAFFRSRVRLPFPNKP